MARVLREQAGEPPLDETSQPPQPPQPGGRRPRNAPAGPTAPTAPIALTAPRNDVHRWVPIGPSVVRNGQAVGSPRVVGRIRDLQVSADGARAYAASAKGGVWYTGDAGASWEPVGGFQSRTVNLGGNLGPLVCGCLLVSFGATAQDDHVMVGTGELVPFLRFHGAGQWGGLGVFAGEGPADPLIPGLAWDSDTGVAQLEGRGIFRLARHPTAQPGRRQGALPNPIPAVHDTVVAAANDGLYVGVLSIAPTTYQWTREATLDVQRGANAVTDLLWLPGGANGRLFVAIDSVGVFYADDVGGVALPTYTAVPGMAGANVPRGRISFGAAPGGALYVLGERTIGAVATPTLWRIAVPGAAVVAAPLVVATAPSNLWQRPGRGSQRDYDQALTVETNAGTDRVYLGGSIVRPLDMLAGATNEAHGSVWCFDVTGAPAAPALTAVAGVSQQGNPTSPPAAAAGANAPLAGLVGNGVHPDIHAIRLGGPAAPNRHVWVASDGGVFVSTASGRSSSFGARSNGIAALEVGYVAVHPTSGHFAAIGVHDNGSEVRSGDTVWEAIQLGDGGGQVFHTTRSDVILSQFFGGNWFGVPTDRSNSPLNRARGGGTTAVPESGVAAFYSVAASIAHGVGGRIAIGTNRVWISDNVGTTAPPALPTWAALPAVGAPGAAAADTYVTNLAGFVDTNAAFGVPAGALGSVISLRFATDTVLYALYQSGVMPFPSGVVRYVEAPAGTWTATVIATAALGVTTFTDIAPVPGSLTDFYLTTTGEMTAGTAPLIDTCWLFTGGAFAATQLRDAMSVPRPPDPGPVLLQGPLDPAYSVVVDPALPTEVYVGTATGVWKQALDTTVVPNVRRWTAFVNGLPATAAQDLVIWQDPVAGGPRLLRAAMQSRGVWEVDLLAAAEPRRTYLRVHARDDRRRFPTPMANPRRRPGGTAHVAFASPDIVVRPRMNPTAAPRWLFGANQIPTVTSSYELWTFQTAMRWIHPSVIPTGLWTVPFADLVRQERATRGLPAGAFIDRALWDAVVGGTHLTAAGAVSAVPADPLSVFRPSWQWPAVMTVPGTVVVPPATEIDVIESVQPNGIVADVWHVHSEPSTVDVLLHHRDTREVPANDAFALLLWQSNFSRSNLLARNLSSLPAFVAGVVAGGAIGAKPGNFNLEVVGGSALHRLPVPLDARMPRAVAIDVDLTAVTAGQFVLFVAVAGSVGIDPCAQPPARPVAELTNVTELVRNWTYAAARLVQVFPR